MKKRKKNLSKIIIFSALILIVLLAVIFVYFSITGKVSWNCALSGVDDIPEYTPKIIGGVAVTSLSAYHSSLRGVSYSTAELVVGQKLSLDFANPVQTIIIDGKTYSVKLESVLGSTADFIVTNEEGVSVKKTIFKYQQRIQNSEVNGIYLALTDIAYSGLTSYSVKVIAGSSVLLGNPAKKNYPAESKVVEISGKQYLLELVSSTDTVNKIKVIYNAPCPEKNEPTCKGFLCFLKKVF